MSDLSIGEAAKKLGVHVDTLRRWEENGKLRPKYTTGGHRRYLLDDILEFSNTVNVFYEVYNCNNNALEKLVVRLGDQEIVTRIGCFEALLVRDANFQLTKTLVNCLLGVNYDFELSHPSLLTAQFPKNFLDRSKENSPYCYRMGLTTAINIDDISRFTQWFKGDARPGWEQVDDLDEHLKALKDDERNRRKTIIDCNGVYETNELPDLKFRCTQYAKIPGTAVFGSGGYLFTFGVSV